jgi:hypothetical protein
MVLKLMQKDIDTLVILPFIFCLCNFTHGIILLYYHIKDVFETNLNQLIQLHLNNTNLNIKFKMA